MYNLQKDLEQARMDKHASALAIANRKWEDYQTPQAALEVSSAANLWRQARMRYDALEALEEMDPEYIETLNQIEQTLQAEQHQASEDDQLEA